MAKHAPSPSSGEALTDALLAASRALVAVAARSIAQASDDVTLPQYRALYLLATRGPQTVSALAEQLSIHPSTATRLCDRLVAKRLILRRPATDDRREVSLLLAAKGRRLVDHVAERRRRDIAAIVDRMPAAARAKVVEVLRSFTVAAGEQASIDTSTWPL
jgi:DNA-binding MarR family transcriptional regulator